MGKVLDCLQVAEIRAKREGWMARWVRQAFEMAGQRVPGRQQAFAVIEDNLKPSSEEETYLTIYPADAELDRPYRSRTRYKGPHLAQASWNLRTDEEGHPETVGTLDIDIPGGTYWRAEIDLTARTMRVGDEVRTIPDAQKWGCEALITFSEEEDGSYPTVHGVWAASHKGLRRAIRKAVKMAIGTCPIRYFFVDGVRYHPPTSWKPECPHWEECVPAGW